MHDFANYINGLIQRMKG